MQNRLFRIIPIGLILMSGIFLLQCQKEIVPKQYRPSTAHARYKAGLEEAGLGETALGRDWIEASYEALVRPVAMSPPYEEAFFIDSTSAFSVGYRFEVTRGQRIEVEVTVESRRPIRMFIDLFRMPPDSAKDWIRVASADSAEMRLEFEPRRTADYVVRLQSELLRGGRCRIVIQKVPALAFPVPSRTERSILSFFGDPRDGGRREHHGIDIFGPRHSSITAPAAGRVRYVGESGIGGDVVWLFDSKRYLYYYFAHLQSFSVQRNDEVVLGQEIGTMGNSGNARTTAPHLHFGIYVPGSGPVDPLPFFTKTDTIPDPIRANVGQVGHWMRTTQRARLSSSLTQSNQNNGRMLDRQSVMRVVAASGNRYRVRLPGGEIGTISASHLQLAENPIAQREAEIESIIVDSPSSDGIMMASLNGGSSFSVMGQYNGHWLVQFSESRHGWMKIM